MTERSGTLDAIWIKRAHRGPMDPAPRVSLERGQGIRDNADQRGKRQVTLIDGNLWDSLKHTLHPDVDPSMRRANLLVRGVQLADSRGRILRIGHCRIQFHGETKPCERMDAAHAGLRAALMTDWGGGAYGEVLDDGEIAVGDTVQWEAES